MPRITISYRRDDSLDITGRIFDRLAAHFGREAVFRDIDNIPAGADFRKHVDIVLEQSDIILAIVGPRWIGPRSGQSRLASPADPVRLEIETALRKEKPLIPVLVSRAPMPRPEQLPDSLQDFAYRNAVQVDAGQDFDVHIARLIRAMDRILEGAGVHSTPANVEASVADAEVVPSEPEILDTPLADQGPLPKPESKLYVEIAILREANRALEAKLAALTAAYQEASQAAAQSSDEFAAAALIEAKTVGQQAVPVEAQRDKQPLQPPPAGFGFGLFFTILFILVVAALVTAAIFYIRQTEVIAPWSHNINGATPQPCYPANDKLAAGQNRSYCRDASGNWSLVPAK